jgi:uncharacterized LabA/DUF88 family protein
VTTSERGKTICFIDDANVFHGGRQAGWRVDWARFDKYLERTGPVWQVYYFASRHEPPNDDEMSFFNFLKEELRWEVALYELGRRTVRCDNCGHTEVVPTEKGVDVGLAIKMLTLATNQAFETALLVAGDRDYLETVKFVKGLGLRVQVMAWKRALSDDLEIESSDPVVYLDSLRSELERR